jgi:alkaline phosphatase
MLLLFSLDLFGGSFILFIYVLQNHDFMKKYSWFILIIFLTGIYSCVNSSEKGTLSEPEVKNIIFLIGDGMGAAQVYAAMESSEEVLNMEKAEYAGLCKTYSLSSKITDSAAGGTALATGTKTANGVIGQDTSGVVFKSILEYAEENGLASGLISTSAITHATPASFIAHQPSRNMYEAIAADFLKTDIDVFIGGGYDHFANRKDGVNLIDSLLLKGYWVDTTLEDLLNANSAKLAGLLAKGHLPPYRDGRNDMLPQATAKALSMLSQNEKGFFLMVEGSQIDWGGHANDIDYVLTETLDFDRTVGVALEFAEKNPGTLVVVTSDHETGGLTLPAAESEYNKTTSLFSTGGHSAVMVPVFSYGPGADRFSGIMDNTDFFHRFMELLGFEK